MFSEPDLSRWGRQIGKEAEPPLFLALRGPLGAGKSALARAICRGAGVQGAIPSPTFNLLLRYPASRGVEIVHVDLYRIGHPAELRELGWDDLGAPHEIVLVEWAEHAGDRLPEDRWDVELRHVPGEPALREMTVTRVGEPNPLPDPPGSSGGASTPSFLADSA